MERTTMDVYDGRFPTSTMIINADSLLPHLKTLVRPTQSDPSRHLLCPDCGTRTKLNTLGDGRRKCTVCGKKFRIHKTTDDTKLRQCSEILLCFCLDFTAQTTVQITRHRYRLVATYYDHFRRLCTEETVPIEKKVFLRRKEVEWREKKMKEVQGFDDKCCLRCL